MVGAGCLSREHKTPQGAQPKTLPATQEVPLRCYTAKRGTVNTSGTVLRRRYRSGVALHHLRLAQPSAYNLLAQALSTTTAGNFKIDDFSILGTEAFHDFDERGVDDLTHGHGDSFGELSDFSSTKSEGDFRHVGVAYQSLGSAPST